MGVGGGWVGGGVHMQIFTTLLHMKRCNKPNLRFMFFVYALCFQWHLFIYLFILCVCVCVEGGGGGGGGGKEGGGKDIAMSDMFDTQNIL